MTAKEIREQVAPRTSAATETASMYMFLGKMLQEIAAQLADLNEHLQKVDESVFGAAPSRKKLDTVKS